MLRYVECVNARQNLMSAEKGPRQQGYLSIQQESATSTYSEDDSNLSA